MKLHIFNVPGLLILAQYVQAISCVATPVRKQWCLAMATRMMPILLLGKNIVDLTGICDLLKVDSLSFAS